MIHEVAGDILLTKAQAVAHGVAPNDHFDSGLALALRENWPAMAKDFRHYAHQTHPKPGELWVWGGVGGVAQLSREQRIGEESAEKAHGRRLSTTRGRGQRAMRAGPVPPDRRTPATTLPALRTAP